MKQSIYLLTSSKQNPILDEYNGVCILFGQNPMSSEVDDASIAALIEEATDSSPRIGLRANHELRDRKDIPLLNNHYTTLMKLYGRVKTLQIRMEMNAVFLPGRREL